MIGGLQKPGTGSNLWHFLYVLGVPQSVLEAISLSLKTYKQCFGSSKDAPLDGLSSFPKTD